MQPRTYWPLTDRYGQRMIFIGADNDYDEDVNCENQRNSGDFFSIFFLLSNETIENIKTMQIDWNQSRDILSSGQNNHLRMIAMIQNNISHRWL